MQKLMMTAAACALAVWATSGCTALMVGGGSPGSSGHRQSTPASQPSRDGGTTAAVRDLLVSDPMLGSYDIGVSTSGSRVTLRGTVGSYAARKRAGEIAASVATVAAVENRIVVERN